MFRGGCEWFDRHTKCDGEVSLHFQLKLNTAGGLIIPTHNNLNDRAPVNVVAVPRELSSQTYNDTNCFSWFGGGGGGNSLLKFV